MFECTECNNTLPAERYRHRPDRNNWRNPKCRKCERKIQIENYYKLKEEDPFEWKIRNLINNRSRHITREWIQETLERQQYKCTISGRKLDPLTFEVDHKIPRAKGGGDELENLQLVNRQANIAKQDLTNDELILLCQDILMNLLKSSEGQ